MPSRTTPPRIYFTTGPTSFVPDSPPIDTRRNLINTVVSQYTTSQFPNTFYIPRKSAAIFPVDLGAGDFPFTRALGHRVFSVLPSYEKLRHDYVPRRNITLPAFHYTEVTIPIPFTDKTKHLFSEYFDTKNLSLERQAYYIQRKYYYVTDNPAPTFTTGYLIAFQPNSFQIHYPGLLNAFQGMSRYIAIPSLTVNELFTITIGPLMREYKRGTAIPFECTIVDPTEIPPLPFNPESVLLNLIRPNGTNELALQSMAQVDQGKYRYVWQSTSDNATGLYRVDIQGTSGVNVARTISQVSFRLVD